MDLTVLRELPDGSFLAHVNDPAAVHARNRRNGARRRRGSTLPPETGPLPGMTIRVIGFRLEVTADDGSTRTERYRLITTLLDWRAFPAAGLAAAYARRWAVEIGHRWYRSSCAAFSWWRSFVVAGFRFLRCPAGAAVEARRACPAFA
jgi:hypothetical protein